MIPRTVYIVYFVLILFMNIFLVLSNFYVIHKSNQSSERRVDKEDVTLGKLKHRVMEVTISEYKTTVSNSMDQYIKLASSANHHELDRSKYVQKVLNETSLTLAFLNLILLVPFWRCSRGPSRRLRRDSRPVQGRHH